MADENASSVTNEKSSPALTLCSRQSSEKERADSTLSNLSQYLGSEGYSLWEMPLEIAAAKRAAHLSSRGSRDSQGLLATEALPPGSTRVKLSFTEPTAPGTGDAQVCCLLGILDLSISLVNAIGNVSIHLYFT